MKLISETLNSSSFLAAYHPLMVDSSMFITEDGSYSILLNIDYDLKLLTDILNLLQPNDSVQLYRILVKGKETWYLCLTVYIDYKSEQFSFRNIFKSSLSKYPKIVEDQTKIAVRKLSAISGKSEIVFESLPVKILNGLGGSNGCVGSIRNLHHVKRVGNLSSMDQIMLCYRVVVPSVQQRKMMLTTYADRSVKMHRQKYGNLAAHVDTVDLTSVDAVDYLGNILFSTCNFYVWSNSDAKTVDLLKDLRIAAQEIDLIIGVSNVNKRIEFGSLYPGNASYGYDYDVVSKMFADMTIDVIGRL